MIEIKFDENNLPSEQVLRATGFYLRSLADIFTAERVDAQLNEQTMTVKLDVDTSAAKTRLAELGRIAIYSGKPPAPDEPADESKRTDFIRDDENEPVDVGTDADRPNVDGFGHAPVSADVVQSQIAPDTSTPPNASTVPAPPPAPVVPAPPAPAIPSVLAETDKHGLPWDERIHASSRAKVADGSWRMRRGVEPALVQQVEAELRAAGPAVIAPDYVRTEDPLATEIEYNDTGAQFVVPQTPPPPPPPPPAATSPTQITQGTQVKTFAEFTMWAAHLQRSKTVSLADITAALQTLRIPNIPTLAQRPELLPAAVGAIQQLLPMEEE